MANSQLPLSSFIPSSRINEHAVLIFYIWNRSLIPNRHWPIFFWVKTHWPVCMDNVILLDKQISRDPGAYVAAKKQKKHIPIHHPNAIINMHLIPSLYQTPQPFHMCNVQSHYLRCAPKFVRFLLVDVSFSLSSGSVVFFFDLLAFLIAVVDVGVGRFDGPSRNAADDGVAPAGVEPPDPGVIPSCKNPWLAFSSTALCQHRLCALQDY